jgi:hypothetical protein
MFILVTEYIWVTPLVQLFDVEKDAIASAIKLTGETRAKRCTVYRRTEFYISEIVSFADGQSTDGSYSEVERG